MEQNAAIWISQFDVCSFDVDLLKRLSIQSICKFFQESAWLHAEKLGIGYSHLASLGKFWVLSKMVISLKQLPVWGEKIYLRTWPSSFQPLFAIRDFEILNHKKEPVIAGSSSWIIINIQSRRPQRIESYVSSIPIMPIKNSFNVEVGKIPEITNVEDTRIITSVYSDLDMNGHVNNIRYASWIIDSYPVEFHKSHFLKRFSINYTAETTVGEQIKIETEQASIGEYLHSIRRLRDKLEICRISAVWDKVFIS